MAKAAKKTERNFFKGSFREERSNIVTGKKMPPFTSKAPAKKKAKKKK